MAGAKAFIPSCFVLTVLLTACTYAEDTYCHEKDIRKCMKPTLDYLKQNVRSTNSLLLVSIQHFLILMDELEHGEELIHVHALDTIIKPLDRLLVEGEGQGLKQLCPKINQTMKCLNPHKNTCDGDKRDYMDGLIGVFTKICKPETLGVFRRENPCILNDGLVNKAITCERHMNSSIGELTLPVECIYTNDSITQECQDSIHNVGEKLLREGHIIPINSKEESHVYSARICTIVRAALLCYKHTVQESCSEEAAEFEYDLRHALVHFMLADLNCEGETGPYCNSSLFMCDSGTCVSKSKVCDRKSDCEDGSDEDEALCETGGMGMGSIIVFILVAILIASITAVCVVVKCVQESKFNSNFSSSSDHDEMMDIVTEELSVGRSTPPPTSYNAATSDNKFIYKPVQT